MQNERCVKWEPVPDINYPCADISFGFDQTSTLWVIMHFSRVKSLLPRDLKLQFKKPLAFRWEDESCSTLILPKLAPKCLESKWMQWNFPLLHIENSSWLKQYKNNQPVLSQEHVHLVLIAMNDCVELIALPHVEANWIEAIK